MFGGHVGTEKRIGLVDGRFGSPYFESIVEEASFVDVLVTQTKELGIRDGFIAVSGKVLTVAKLKEKVCDGGWWGPLSCHTGVVDSEVLGCDGTIVSP